MSKNTNKKLANNSNDTQAVEVITDTQAVEVITDTQAVEVITDTQAVEVVTDTQAVEVVTDTQAVEVINETPAVEVVTVSENGNQEIPSFTFNGVAGGGAKASGSKNIIESPIKTITTLPYPDSKNVGNFLMFIKTDGKTNLGTILDYLFVNSATPSQDIESSLSRQGAGLGTMQLVSRIHTRSNISYENGDNITVSFGLGINGLLVEHNLDAWNNVVIPKAAKEGLNMRICNNMEELHKINSDLCASTRQVKNIIIRIIQSAEYVRALTHFRLGASSPDGVNAFYHIAENMGILGDITAVVKNPSVASLNTRDKVRFYLNAIEVKERNAKQDALNAIASKKQA